MNIFEQHESEVRGYCRSFPAVFSTAKGAWMTDTTGRRYLLSYYVLNRAATDRWFWMRC